MKIHVCSLVKVGEIAQKHKPTKIVSLLGPGTPFPSVEGYNADCHLKVELDDIRKDIDGHTAPNTHHIVNLIDFLKLWDTKAPLLAHCWAGISRSSATAFIAACLHNPNSDEQMIADAIANNSPTAYPNTLMVSIADDILSRGGRMTQAAENICDDESRKINIHTIDETKPFSIPAIF